MSRQLASKWRKTAALMKYPVAAVHIPQTKAFNSGNLLQMLSRYGMVYVKPIVGGGGYGVIRVSASGGAISIHPYENDPFFRQFQPDVSLSGACKG